MATPSYEMRSLRKEDLSLYLYIKDIVLRPFQETEENVQLQLMPELCDVDSYVYQYVSNLEPSPTERGRGWVYFNPPSGTLPCQPYTTVSGRNGDGELTSYGIPEQTNQIVVYNNGVELDWRDYMVDYLDGRIITQNKLTNPTIDFTWNYVSVVDEWAAIEAADPPVIVIDVHGTDKAGYQLGGGKKSVRKVDIHVFASDPAERNDIVETLYDGLFNRSCPLLNFPTGSVLDYDGTFYGRKKAKDTALELGIDVSSEEYVNKLTFLFDRERATNVSSLFFDSVTARHVNLPLIMTRGTDEVMLSDLNAYRSKVSFDMFTYDDRNTGRTY
jgi:hypothetical protein